MTATPLDLGSLERRLYRRRWDHGLLDLAIGLGLALIATDLWLGEAYGFALFAVLAVPVGRGIEARWVLPRTGRVRFGEERRRRLGRGQRALQVGLVLAALAGVIVFLVTGPRAGDGRGRLVMGLLLGVAVGGSAVVLDLHRLWVWALAIPTAFLVGHAFGSRAEQPLFILTVGIAIALVGVMLFVRFLRRHPRAAEEAPA